MDSELSFESALRRLEEAVGELESGELGLDGALARYEEGVRLLAHCHGLLDGAGRKVALLAGLDGDGRPTTAPFDGAATDAATAPEPRPRPRVAEADDDLPF